MVTGKFFLGKEHHQVVLIDVGTCRQELFKGLVESLSLTITLTLVKRRKTKALHNATIIDSTIKENMMW